jgi:16S rRNA (guanine527-N7)-methyltransferase
VTLQETLTTHGFTTDAETTTRLNAYCQMLWEWNSRINLTRHTDYESFVTRDLHDSRQLLKHLQSTKSVLDIGSGGGVPGIVMAILQPGLAISLCESTQKKAAALESMVSHLGLQIPVLAQRAEDIIRAQKFETITARAVAPLPKILAWFRPHRKQFRRLVLIKGPNWTTERDTAEDEGLLRRVQIDIVDSYETIGRDGESVILEVRFT